MNYVIDDFSIEETVALWRADNKERSLQRQIEERRYSKPERDVMFDTARAIVCIIDEDREIKKGLPYKTMWTVYNGWFIGAFIGEDYNRFSDKDVFPNADSRIFEYREIKTWVPALFMHNFENFLSDFMPYGHVEDWMDLLRLAENPHYLFLDTDARVELLKKIIRNELSTEERVKYGFSKEVKGDEDE